MYSRMEGTRLFDGNRTSSATYIKKQVFGELQLISIQGTPAWTHLAETEDRQAHDRAIGVHAFKSKKMPAFLGEDDS